MNKIYVVNGLPGSGKTLFGELVGKSLKEKGVDFLHTSSIDPVKAILRPRSTWGTSLTRSPVVVAQLERLKDKVVERDWDGETKDSFWRKAMSDLKMEIVCYHSTLLHGLVLEKLNTLKKPCVGFVDIREPEEIESFKEHIESTRLGVQVEKILMVSDKGESFRNRSDASIHEASYDIVIENPRSVFVDDNISLWFLRCRANTFIEQEILEGRSKERFY